MNPSPLEVRGPPLDDHRPPSGSSVFLASTGSILCRQFERVETQRPFFNEALDYGGVRF